MDEKRIVVWAGFIDGHLDLMPAQDAYSNGHYLRPALFRTRAEARRRYSDVRRVVINEHDAVPA
jgi:hypothetical protein